MPQYNSYEEFTLPDISQEENILEVLPSNFEQTLQSLNISLVQENRVELLRYGQTIIENPGLDFAFILQNSDPLLINKEMYIAYLSIKEQKAYKRIVEEDLLPKLRNILNSSNTILSVWNVVDKREEIQTTWDAVLDSLVLANESQYTEAMDILYNMNEKEKRIFATLISLTNTRKEYEDIVHINSLIDTEGVLQDEKEIEVTQKPTEIYIEDISEVQNSFLTNLQEKLKALPSNISFKKKTENLQKEITETNIEEIYSSLLQSNYTQEKNVKILLKVINENDKALLTISPYTQEEELELVDDNNFSEPYDSKPLDQAKGTVRIPVLMYHQIATAPKGSSKFKQGLYVSPEVFEKQIAYLTRMNYKTVSSKEFSEILATGKNPTQKTVMLTFDDSHPTHYTQAYPILKKYGQTGVFFVPSSRSAITSDQLEEMALNGMIIDSHSATHPNLSITTDESLLSKEIAGSKATLQARTNKPVYAIAYPGCVANDKTFQMVASSGYLLGFSCGRKIDHYATNKYSISRVHVFGDMESFIDLLSGKN